MTIFAFCLLCFIKDKCILINRYALVAFRTGQSFMFPVQPECCLIMIKTADFPNICIVAAQAVGHPVFIELLVVIVLMAHRAVRRHILEPLGLKSGCVLRKMTGTAGEGCMGPGNDETGFGMIIGDVSPARLVVAVRAAGSGKIVCAHESFVDILVAICTAGPDLPEGPFLLLLMAGNAGGGKMGPLQAELPAVVTFNGEGRTSKTGRTMAIAAILHHAVADELIFVIIRMAIRAPVVFHRIGDICFMA